MDKIAKFITFTKIAKFITFCMIPFIAGLSYQGRMNGIEYEGSLNYFWLLSTIFPSMAVGICIMEHVNKKTIKENKKLKESLDGLIKKSEKVEKFFKDQKAEEGMQLQNLMDDIFEDTPIDTYYVKGVSDEDNTELGPGLYVVLSDGECTVEHPIALIEDMEKDSEDFLRVDGMEMFEQAKMAWYAKRNAT